jgi:MFS family permease
MGWVRGALTLGLGFVAVRMLGQGSLSLVSQNVINQWWQQRRGTMMGLSGVVSSLLGLSAFPALINWLISFYGWRLSYGLLGGLLLLVMVPLGFLFFSGTARAVWAAAGRPCAGYQSRTHAAASRAGRELDTGRGAAGTCFLNCGREYGCDGHAEHRAVLSHG